MPLIAELQRRRVFRALAGYAVVAFAVLQIRADARYPLLLRKLKLSP